MSLHGRPLGRDDAIDASIAERPVCGELMAAQDPVELRAQAFDRAPALMVEKMGSELDSDAIQRLKRVAEQQKFGVRVELGPLHALAIPGSADFQAAIDRIDIK